MTARWLIGLSLFPGVALASPASSSVQMRLSPFIGDGMVVQRGARVSISGSGSPGDRVVVTLGSHALRGVSANDGKSQLPTALYDQMIHPLLEYPLQGVLRYQWEPSADVTTDAPRCREQLPALIRDRHKRWSSGDVPFLFVQLANYMPAGAEPPALSHRALPREAQTPAPGLPRAARAVIIDVGDARDIHSRDRQHVGGRLALAARKVAHGEDLVYSRPTHRRRQIGAGRVSIAFDHPVAVRYAGPRPGPAETLQRSGVAGSPVPHGLVAGAAPATEPRIVVVA